MPYISQALETLDQEDARQMVGLARLISHKRGRQHPEAGTVEVPLDLLNQLSILASLYEGATLTISQHLCQTCPLKDNTGSISIEQKNG